MKRASALLVLSSVLASPTVGYFRPWPSAAKLGAADTGQLNGTTARQRNGLVDGAVGSADKCGMKKSGSHLVRRLHYVQDGLPAFDCLCASAMATEPHPFERQSVDAAWIYRGPGIRRTTRASLYRPWWRVYRSWCRGCRSWWRGYSWQALLWRGLVRYRTPLLERPLVSLRCGCMLAFLPDRLRLGLRIKDRAPLQ